MAEGKHPISKEWSLEIAFKSKEFTCVMSPFQKTTTTQYLEYVMSTTDNSLWILIPIYHELDYSQDHMFLDIRKMWDIYGL